MPKASGRIGLLLALLDESYERKAWHGPNLRGSLRGVTAKQAAWRPAAGRHNIWELALHSAYWKYAARNRMTGGARGTFPEKGSNWFARPSSGGANERAWRSDVRLLDEQHRELRRVAERFPERGLDRRAPGGRYTFTTLLYGIAAHDVYHAGQIQLLKRLQRKP